MNDNDYKERVIASMGEDMFNKYEAFRTEMQEVICKHHLIMEDTRRTTSCILASLVHYIFETDETNSQQWTDLMVDAMRRSKQARRRDEW